MDIIRHLDEEELERYSLQTTVEPELSRVEEHLLVCPDCRHRVEASDIYLESMRRAASDLRQKPEKAARNGGIMHFAFALIAAGLLFVFLIPRNTPPPFAVSLAATRGAEMESQAPAGSPLALHLDITGLPPTPVYKAEMVDRTGKQVWTGTFPGKQVSPQPAGVYFVRLYSPAGELLREYGLEIVPRR